MMKSVFDPSWDGDLGLSPDDKLQESIADHLSRCQSCNVPLVNHLGLFGTCAELIEARKRCEELAAAVSERDKSIVQLADMVSVKDMEIRKLQQGIAND